MLGIIWGACYLLSSNITLYENPHMTRTTTTDAGPGHACRKTV